MVWQSLDSALPFQEEKNLVSAILVSQEDWVLIKPRYLLDKTKQSVVSGEEFVSERPFDQK